MTIVDGNTSSWLSGKTVVFWFTLFTIFLGDFPLFAQNSRFNFGATERGLTEAEKLSQTGYQTPAPQLLGSIDGRLLDPSGAPVTGALVKLARQDSTDRETVSNAEGQFSFGDVVPGAFQLMISAPGFATQPFSGILHAGEHCIAPAITLSLAPVSTEVQVTLSRTELADMQIKDQEKQKVFGVVPNFYVAYDPHSVPLNAKQKFGLAWKSTVEPINFMLSGATAGIQQATNGSSGYGQGAQGYAKRYAASYLDLVTANFVGSAVFPTLLKQDPRYFYKGKGGMRSRILYAITASIVCKGDNGHWQANYSAIAGGLAAGEISNLYHAPTNWGAASTIETALLIIGSTAADNILQEFVIRKLTPHVPNYARVDQAE